MVCPCHMQAIKRFGFERRKMFGCKCNLNFSDQFQTKPFEISHFTHCVWRLNWSCHLFGPWKENGFWCKPWSYVIVALCMSMYLAIILLEIVYYVQNELLRCFASLFMKVLNKILSKENGRTDVEWTHLRRKCLAQRKAKSFRWI